MFTPRWLVHESCAETRNAPRSSSIARPRRRPHIHTVSFDPADDAWTDALVEALLEAGVPDATRSVVIRVALQALREVLAELTGPDLSRFFVQRHADRLLSGFDDTSRLPFD